MAPDRPVFDASGQQAGDQQIGGIAGRDIHHVGMDPAEALSFVRDYLLQADHRREARDLELSRRVDRLADALELHEISESQRRTADEQQRHTRQLATDRQQRRIMVALVALALAWLVGLAILALLLYDRYLAESLVRLWLGAGAALVAGARR